jgi:hypothetical protein
MIEEKELAASEGLKVEGLKVREKRRSRCGRSVSTDSSPQTNCQQSDMRSLMK